MNRRFLLESLAALFLAPIIPAAAKPKPTELYTVTIHPSDDDQATLDVALRDVDAHGGGVVRLAAGNYRFNHIVLMSPIARISVFGAPGFKSIIQPTIP